MVGVGLRPTLTIVQESTIWDKKLLMSCANSERFRVDFSLKLCIASVYSTGFLPQLRRAAPQLRHRAIYDKCILRLRKIP